MKDLNITKFLEINLRIQNPLKHREQQILNYNLTAKNEEALKPLIENTNLVIAPPFNPEIVSKESKLAKIIDKSPEAKKLTKSLESNLLNSSLYDKLYVINLDRSVDR